MSARTPDRTSDLPPTPSRAAEPEGSLGEAPLDSTAALSKRSASDQRLITDFLGGEPQAVATISQWVLIVASRYRRRLRRDWEDLVQSLLLEVTSALQEDSFRRDCTLRTYVWRIAQYRCINRVRDLSRRPPSVSEDLVFDLPDPARPALDRLVEQESEDRLRQFLEQVSADCQLLWKRILAGKTYREISRETGVSEGTLRVRVLRCRHKAMDQWQAWIRQPQS